MTPLPHSRWIWSAILVAYAVLIFAVSSLQLGDSPGVLPFAGADKLFHACEFAVFLILARLAFGRLSVALVVTAVYAASDELHQAFVPTRDASWADFGFDLLGAALAAAAFEGVRRIPLLRRIAGRILDFPYGNRERGR